MVGIGYAGSIYGRYRRHLGLGPHSPIPLPMKGPLTYRFFISPRCITEIMSAKVADHPGRNSACYMVRVAMEY